MAQTDSIYLGKITALRWKSGAPRRAGFVQRASFRHRRLEMASAYALAINRGKFIYVSRLSRPAGRSKRIFTEGAVKENRKFSGEEVVSGLVFSREKVVQKHPQVFLNHKS